MVRAVCCKPRGFTLLEMLIAISLLAVVSLLSWRALDSLTRSRTQLSERAEQYQGMRQLFSQFDSDCAALAPYPTLHQAPVSLRDNGLLLVRQVSAPLANASPPDSPAPSGTAVTQWQVVLYRWVRDEATTGLGHIERLASAPSTQRTAIDSALRNLATADSSSAAQRHVLLHDTQALQATAWVEGVGWVNQAAVLAAQFPAWTAQQSGGAVKGLSLNVSHRSGVLQKTCLVAQ